MEDNGKPCEISAKSEQIEEIAKIIHESWECMYRVPYLR